MATPKKEAPTGRAAGSVQKYATDADFDTAVGTKISIKESYARLRAEVEEAALLRNQANDILQSLDGNRIPLSGGMACDSAGDVGILQSLDSAVDELRFTQSDTRVILEMIKDRIGI